MLLFGKRGQLEEQTKVRGEIINSEILKTDGVRSKSHRLEGVPSGQIWDDLSTHTKI